MILDDDGYPIYSGANPKDKKPEEYMELEPHEHCPFCEGYCVERWEDEEVKYGDALYPEKQVTLTVHIPTYYCTSCKFGWRDFRSEQIIDEAVQRYLKANERKETNQ